MIGFAYPFPKPSLLLHCTLYTNALMMPEARSPIAAVALPQTRHTLILFPRVCTSL